MRLHFHSASNTTTINHSIELNKYNRYCYFCRLSFPIIHISFHIRRPSRLSLTHAVTHIKCTSISQCWISQLMNFVFRILNSVETIGTQTTTSTKIKLKLEHRFVDSLSILPYQWRCKCQTNQFANFRYSFSSKSICNCLTINRNK